MNIGFVTGFAELKKVESDKLLDFFVYHIHSADDHAVRWKWSVGSVAMWDNRCGSGETLRTGLIDLTGYSLQMHTPSSNPWNLYRPSKGHPDDCVWGEA